MKKCYIIAILGIVCIVVFGCVKKDNVSVKKVEDKTKPIQEIIYNDPLVPSDVDIDCVVFTDEEGGVLYNRASADRIVLPKEYSEKYINLTNAIDAYNIGVENYAKNFINEQKPEIRTMRRDRNDDTLVLSYDDVITIIRVDDIVFSFLENNSSYTGGVHGSSAMFGWNFSPKSGEKLSSKDIFTDKNKLKNVLIERIEAEYSDLFDDWKDTLENHFKEDKELNILVGDKYVDIMFDPYYLGPWATGTITVTLLYKDYKDLLKKGYFIE